MKEEKKQKVRAPNDCAGGFGKMAAEVGLAAEGISTL